MARDVLMLNGDWTVHDVIPWRKALRLCVAGKVTVQESFPDVSLSWFSGNMPHPSVVVLKRFIRIPFDRRFRINKRNLLLRDGHKCQYCGCALHAGTVTVDHVVPQSRGGLHRWNNVVACCKKCNNRKGDKAPKDVGMHLLANPYTPNRELVYMGYTAKPEYASWKVYFSEGGSDVNRQESI